LPELRSFAKRIGLLGLSNLLVTVSNILILPVLTKKLPIDDYGIWIQLIITSTLLSNFLTLALPNSIPRFLAPKKEKNEIQEDFYSLLFFVLAINIVSAFILFVMASTVAAIFFAGNIFVAKMLLPITFFTSLNSLFLVFFLARQNVKKYTLMLLTQTYLNVILVVLVLTNGYGINGAITAYLVSQITVCLLMGSLITRQIGIKLPHFLNLKQYLNFSLPLIPSVLAFWAVNSCDRYVINFFLGVSWVGYYSPGYTLGNLIILFAYPFASLLPASLATYYDENRVDAVQVLLKYSTKYFLVLAVPAATVLCVLSKPILATVTTSNIATYAWFITPFTAISAVLYGLYTITSQVITLEKKTRLIGMIWACAAILNIGVNIVLVPYIGILGAAASTLLSYTFVFIMATYYASKLFRFDFEFDNLIKTICAAAFVAFIITAINPIGVIGILAYCLLGLLVYFGLMVILGAIPRNELNFFMELIGRDKTGRR